MNRGKIGREAMFGVLVSVLALAWLAWTVDLAGAAATVQQPDIGWLVPALLVLAVQAAIRAARWAKLAGAASRRSIPAARVVEPMLVGYLANTLLPARLGEAVRAALVARRERVPLGEAAASVVVERAIDLVALLLLAAVALLAAGSDGAWPVAAAAVGMTAIVLLGRRAPALGRLVPSFVPQRITQVVEDVLGAIARLPRGTLLVGALISAVAWLADASLVWMAGQAIGVDVPIPAAIAIGLGGAIGTALPAAPGYIATYELGAVAFGRLAGVAPEVTLPLAVLVHLVGVGALALAGAVALGRVGGSIAFRASPTEALSDLGRAAR